MFHKVLVATGGSRWSQQAVEYAVGLAKDYALELVVLSVVTDTPPYFIAEAGVSLEKVFRSVRVEPEEFLARLHGLHRQLDVSPLTDEIVHRAKNEGRP